MALFFRLAEGSKEPLSIASSLGAATSKLGLLALLP